MFEAILIASTGLQNQQLRLDTISDNVANSNTVGFKASRLDFKEALYTASFAPGPARSPGADQQKGHGVMTAGISKDYKGGAVMTTGEQLDFAIEGEGFFQVMDRNGNRQYTRGGNFYITGREDGLYLVDARGCFVQNDQGQAIRVPEGTDSVAVTETGQITFYTGEEEVSEQFGLYTFTNKTGLSAVGNSRYEQTVASGEPVGATGVVLRQGALEASNVDMATEMTRLIRTQRAFSFASRALTTADDMEGIANRLRG